MELARPEFTITGKKMDEIEGQVLARIPPNALSLVLTRSTIKMEHSVSWSVDKANLVHDMILALDGQGEYRINGQRLTLRPGEALLIPKGTRFEGWTNGPEEYRGIAQHFTLTIFGETDLFDLMDLRLKSALPHWDALEPLARHFRASALPNSVTLAQHHQFMVLLTAAIEGAFTGWLPSAAGQITGGNAIDVAVMQAASRISAAPLDEGMAEAVIADAPYNPDYFQREFQRRIGRTPRKYQELCRMERAMALLEAGMNVSAAASEVGYADPYYFSRMFKRTMGLSPRDHLRKVRQSREGQLMQMDEDAQASALAHAGDLGIFARKRAEG